MRVVRLPPPDLLEAEALIEEHGSAISLLDLEEELAHPFHAQALDMGGQERAADALPAAGRVDHDRQDLGLDAGHARQDEALEAAALGEGSPLPQARRGRNQPFELVLAPAAMEGASMQAR